MQGFGKSVWTKLYTAQTPRLFVSDPLGSFPNVDFVSDPADWWPKIKSGELKQFRFGTYDSAELPTFGHMAYASGDCTMVVEECALMFPRGVDMDEWAKRLIFMGRHPRVNLVMVAQRAVKIPLDIRSQSTRVITFLQTEPEDADALADKIGKQYFDEIMSLPKLQCLDWHNGQVKRYGVRPA